ncbi:hypothetical protein [Marinoscillum sp.]|uniref:hypothetical protein n=1 Tax=Marinoscillum sp. TaxID=2024838 RepID=UPI003BA9FFC1
MKKALLFGSMLFATQLLFAQQPVVSIEQEFDRLTYRWQTISDELITYSGLGDFCASPDFRKETVEVLSTVHHLDSLVLDMMLDPTSGLEVSSREFKKTLKDIYEFEEEYGVRAFIDFLKESCLTRNDLEANTEALKGEVGAYSYDGQVMMLETRLTKYIKHLTNKIESIDEHVHHIHPDQLREIKILAQNEAD